MNFIAKTFLTVLLSCCTLFSFAQEALISSIQSEIVANDLGKLQDVTELVITDQYTSAHNDILHIYLSQSVNGVRIGNSHINAIAQNSTNKIIKVVGNIVSNPGDQASGIESMSLQATVQSQLMQSIGAVTVAENTHRKQVGNKIPITLSGQGYQHTGTAEKIYFQTPEGELKLAWAFDAEMRDHTHWYYYVVDAENGDLLTRYDWTVSCEIGSHSHSAVHGAARYNMPAAKITADGSGYLVYNLPIESPIHGERTLEVEPALLGASPFGWHDTDGETGPEYTETRGNNVFAYEDVNDINQGGSVDGGNGLNFQFEYDAQSPPEYYRDAAITNLFFTNNKVHDIMHMYGFNESAGNFQETNYSGVGLGNDFVLAEAQDGGGVNNANFATPPDGQNPRMQMYLWQSGGGQQILVVNAPTSIAGNYASSGYAGFGPAPTNDITANLVLAEDNVDDTHDGCEGLTNGGSIDGKIALVYRGSCQFTEKVMNAQDEGAVACIIINNEGGLMEMGGFDGDIEIPSILITQEDGALFVDALESDGQEVNVTLQASAEPDMIDGSFDNGIVIHEFAHGISNRLTGGPSEVNCLFNDEQMGEGWSDFYAVALTSTMAADNPAYRPMATFAMDEPIDGIGLRPAPYDTSFTVNSFTYGDIADETLTLPHGIGFVWATVLWDLHWAMIDVYGFDEDIYNGTGGNNMAIQLVTDGLKLQSCNPGFVDGRDAILLADELLYDGAHQCLIWKVFARRGLGFSASQGSSDNRFDGVEAFDIPTLCTEVENPPSAQFSVSQNSSCNGYFQFTDESIDTPQAWLWSFGDGQTSTEQNPSHSYASPGTYSVSLTVSNAMGEDTELIEDLVVYQLPESPSVSVEPGCIGDFVSLTASGDGTIVWTNNSGEEIGTGEELSVELGTQPTSYFASTDGFSSVFIGPEDSNFSNGANHNSTFVGTVDFQTFQPIIIQSAWVVSAATGTRVISLWEGASGEGTLLEEITVDIDFTGGGTIELGFEIATPGTYSIGLNGADLYRNEGNIGYPYTEDGLIKIFGSSAGVDYYYYFYNLEIDLLGCESEPTEAVTEVLGTADFDSEQNGLTVSFIDQSTDATSWNWDFGDGNTSTESNPEHTYQEVGAYTVTLTTNGTCIISQEVNVLTVGIEDNYHEDIVLSPNPASTHLQIEIPGSINNLAEIRLMDVSGRLVKRNNIQSNIHRIQLDELSSGTYVLQMLDTHNAVMFSERVVIAK